MTCKKCGQEISENEKFCSNCGAEVTKEPNLDDTITFGGVEIAKAIIDQDNTNEEPVIAPREVEAEPINMDVEPTMSVDIETPFDKPLEMPTVEEQPIDTNDNIKPVIEKQEENNVFVEEPISHIADLNNEESVAINTMEATPVEVENKETSELPTIEPVVNNEEVPSINGDSNIQESSQPSDLTMEPVLSEDIEKPEKHIIEQSTPENLFPGVPDSNLTINTESQNELQSEEVDNDLGTNEPVITNNIEEPIINPQDVIENQVNNIEPTIGQNFVQQPQQEIPSEEPPVLNKTDVITNWQDQVNPQTMMETPVEPVQSMPQSEGVDRSVATASLNSSDWVIDNSNPQTAIENQVVTPSPSVTPVQPLNVEQPQQEVEKPIKEKSKSGKFFAIYMVTILVLFLAFLYLFVITDIGPNLFNK